VSTSLARCDTEGVRDDVVSLLACPHCAQPLTQVGAALRCVREHSFDIARQGYVNLLGGAGHAASGDTAEMVADRRRFLDAGHYAPLMDALAGHVGVRRATSVLDVGAGTGHYLAAVLEQSPSAVGLAVDASKAAARAAARVHQRADSVLADTWQQLPVRNDSIDVALTVFAPRRAAELRRVLRGDGMLFVLTPTARHLREVVGPLQLLQVDERKPERLEQAMSGFFSERQHTELEFTMSLNHDDLAALVGMGPSAWHAGAQVRAARIAVVPEPMTVTGSVVLTEYGAPLCPAPRSG